MEEVPVDMVKIPLYYRVFFTSKRWLGLNLGISEPSDITTLFGSTSH